MELSTDKRNFLKSCPALLKIKKEIDGGRSFELLGIVEVDLAEFASSKPSSRKYLLQNSRINSALKVSKILNFQVTFSITSINKDYDFLCPQSGKSSEKLEDVMSSNQKPMTSATVEKQESPIDPNELLSDSELNRDVIDKLFVK